MSLKAALAVEKISLRTTACGLGENRHFPLKSTNTLTENSHPHNCGVIHLITLNANQYMHAQECYKFMDYMIDDIPPTSTYQNLCCIRLPTRYHCLPYLPMLTVNPARMERYAVKA
ncbi:hypothetical protein AYL99_12127 [Fonsecaea erecta]|uniref:Uncharacterized protein n=1 Tax=Fonsecaea erecta TaxID=1367422 RepID=A0A178Z2F9_9EURO|nr:hypothetical protein AYL99_12127 [Fonsecaea erecta]OAP53701.1 hypothetical protein AYL99_12127 [Fonsecaea erecta]